MARIDDFIQARALSKRELSEKDIASIARFSGAGIIENGKTLLLKVLNRDIIITWPEMEFSYNGSNEEVPIQQQVLHLHYMNGVCNSKIEKNRGEWISFQDIPDGRFYMDAFIKRAKDPLLRTFGTNPKKMVELASSVYNASPLEFGDFSVAVNAFPMTPVALVLWQGDDEFPAEGNILFDGSISGILSAEDIALLAGMVVYPLIGMAKGKMEDLKSEI